MIPSDAARTLPHLDQARLLDAISSILVVADRDGWIRRCNRAAREAFGLCRNGGQVHLRELAECFVEDRQRRQLLDRERWKRPFRLREVRYRRLDGGHGYLGLTINPVLGEEGDLEGLLLLARDITDRKNLEGQLAHALKLESIGQLAAGIAHEINTPAQYVGDNLRFLEESFGDLDRLLAPFAELLRSGRIPAPMAGVATAAREIDLDYLREEIPAAIRQSLTGIARISEIVRSMKQFSHSGAEGKAPADLNAALRATITVSRNEWKYVAEMETDLDPSLPPVRCRVGELNQVFLNLIVNAAHAIAETVGNSGDKGKIRVSTRRDGEMVEIRIADTGTGIPPEIQHRIFDPFFTTKEVGKGTGQGLSLARNTVVRGHGGELTFETTPGEGTNFIVRLPIEPGDEDEP